METHKSVSYFKNFPALCWIALSFLLLACGGSGGGGGGVIAPPEGPPRQLPL